MPAYESADRQPAVPTDLWFRWFSWKAARDGAHFCEMRMAQHLTHFADDDGLVVDVPAMIEVYAAYHRVTTRTGWADAKRLLVSGWLRRHVSPTGGRTAQYQLCVTPPTVGDLEEMPRELAHAFARHFGLPIGDPPVAQEPGRDGGESHQEPPKAAGRDEELEIDLGPVPRSLAFLHHHLSGCEVVRVGSLTGRRRYSGAACGRLHTTPLPREAFSPSLRIKPSRARNRRSEGIKITLQERAAAAGLMRRCWPAWCAQRPGGTPLTPAEWRPLVDVVAHALRAADNPADVREELTQAIGTARHLPTLLAYRARRIIHRGYRPDRTPTLPPEVIAARRRAAEAAQGGLAATRRAAATRAALRADLVDKQLFRDPETAAAAPLVTTWATEPDLLTMPPGDVGEIERRRSRARALRRARSERNQAPTFTP